jgi:ATP-dependent helicase HrpB
VAAEHRIVQCIGDAGGVPDTPTPSLPLPIDPLLPEALAALKARPALVLTAEPGAGKTTRLPRALLEGGLLGDGECWILEPRRLAARLAAARVADEMGVPLGAEVGYAVRFEAKASKATRLRFVTEGLLLRRLGDDPALKGITAVVLDEFHERHLQTDLAITLLRRLQCTARPDLKVVVMSATLDPGPVAAYLDAAHLQSAGRAHPIELRHLPRPDDRPIGDQVRDAVAALHGEGPKGDILVFLPGAAEIRAGLKACEGLAEQLGLALFPLHGELSGEAQQAALAPAARPKVILSTNVAESTVTLPGIAAVIDSGLGREAVHSPWSGLSRLATARISQARCVQRAGRAGRTGPGICMRLFTEADFLARPAFDAPELQRADLAEALLALHGLGIADPGQLDWFEAPPEAGLRGAEALLRHLGALGEAGALTKVGRRMLALPLHPRLARLVVAGEDLGIPFTARLAAAVLETGELSARASLDRRPDAAPAGPPLDSDLLLRLDQYAEAEAAKFHGGAIRAAGLDGGAVRRASLAVRSLTRDVRGEEPKDAETRLLKALLVAYPDRLAKAGGKDTFAFEGGSGARLDGASRVRKADLIVALEAEAQKAGAGQQATIRAASKVELEWLLEAFPERLNESVSLRFNEKSSRVDRVASLRYGDLLLEETRRPADANEEGVAQCLGEALLEHGLGDGQEVVDRLLDRAGFLAKHRAELGIQEREALLHGLVAKACEGASSLRDLKHLDWPAAMKALLGPEASRLLDAWAPETFQLPKGRPAKVHYSGESPWIESRLQDFWGLKKTPSIAGGSVPLVLHLLAPNMRAVQVTQDLAGFWERAYKELRPALSRRYPKHHWPE